MEALNQEATNLNAFRDLLNGQLERGELKLPMMPQVAGEVISVSNDPEADIMELVDLMHRDQALAGYVLKVSNSAAYGGGESIVSLQQAITRLGMKLLSDIALAISMQGEFFRVAGFHNHLKHLWRLALASGAFGKEVARLKRSNVEEQFLCGLLHTVGQPVLLQVIADLNRQMPVKLTHEETLLLLEEMHCRVGERLAVEWKLPRQVAVACAYYNNYEEAPDYKAQVAMTYLSHQLARWLIVPEVFEGHALGEDPVLEELNIFPEELEGLLSKKEEMLEVVNAMDL